VEQAAVCRTSGPLYLKFALGGLIVGLISIAFPQVWGNGYSVVDAILHQRLLGGRWVLLAVLLAKVASTASTVGSGAVGAFSRHLVHRCCRRCTHRLDAAPGVAAYDLRKQCICGGGNGRVSLRPPRMHR